MAGPSEQSHAAGTLPQAVRRDFSGVGYDEAMRRAREIVPILRERAQEGRGRARAASARTSSCCTRPGCSASTSRRRFGGMELDFVAVVDIPAELARGCPSTAWNVGNLACHHWILGYYEPETQHEVWDANPDALIASSIALAAGRGRKADGGFVVSGRWPFSSGVDNSDWNMLAVTVYGDDGKTRDRLAALPGAEVRLRDHRHLVRHGHGGHRQQGHRGHRAVRAGAPRARARSAAAAGCEHPGAALNAGPALPHPDRGGRRPSAGAGGARRGRGRLRAVPGVDGQARRHLHRRQGRRFPGGADQGRPRALPDRLARATSCASRRSRSRPTRSATRCRTSRPSCASARSRPSP